MAERALSKGRNGLAYDPVGAVATLKKADRVLGRLMGRVGPLRIEPPVRKSPFEMLLRAIVFQQLSGKAADTIHGRVCALFANPRRPRPEDVLGTTIEALRGAGLSNNKALAVRDLAEKTMEGVVPGRAALQRLDDEAVVERLTAVRGVGRWTVEMLLMFYLGRPDVFPVADLGVRKGLALTYGLEDADVEAMGEIADRWRPFRTVGSWYMWRALEAVPARPRASRGNGGAGERE